MSHSIPLYHTVIVFIRTYCIAIYNKYIMTHCTTILVEIILNSRE